MSCIFDEPQPGAAMTATETAIMARWDAGESIERIVRSRAFSAGMVKTTVYRFGGGEAEAPRWARDARAGCAAMAAAIAATGRRYA